MPRVCDICGRGSRSGKKRSHSNIATLRKFMVNLQTKIVNGERKRICTKCLKTLSKEK